MNIPYLFFTSKLTNPRLLNIKKNNTWISYSGSEFLNIVKEATLGLDKLHSQRKMTFKKQEPVGLISPSNPIWLFYSQSIMASGLIPVPAFVNISQTNLQYQIEETGMRYIFICSQEALITIKPFLEKFKRIVYDDIKVSNIPKKYKKKFISFTEIIELGKKTLQSKKNKSNNFITDLKKIPRKQIAIIIYTSGSTGEPKGVMLTHHNLLHQTDGIPKRFPLISGQDYAVSCLPLAHIFEHTIINFFLAQNISVYFSPNLNQLGDNIREIRPTIMTVVPRILGKVYEKMSSASKQQKGIKKILVTKAIEYAESHSLPKSPKDNPRHSILYPIFEKLVYKKFRQALGDNFKVIVNGGAALPHQILRFFINIGVNVVEGYGLTETSPIISTNHLTYNKSYTVGPLFPGIEVKIEDEEILTKSPSVMKGYYKKPKLTKEVMTRNGWFKTGDQGKLDAEGNLIITGRIKDLYKLSNGKYIAPLPLEQKLELNLHVDTALIVADNKKYVSALLFMNTEQENRDSCEENLKEYIKEINNDLNSWEKIVKFKPIWKQLSIEEGEITPKMNIRRKFLLEKYSHEIKKMYM